MVLFPYIVRILLQENEVRFGLAQMCLQLPTTVLILIGGFVADRGNPQRIVIIACGLTVITFLALGLMITTGHLTYGLTIAYALVVGTIGAFAIPARDSLLSQVAPSRDAFGIQKAVSFAALAQFAAQILGMVCAIAAPFIGVGPLLLALSVLMVSATWAAVRLRPRPPEHRPQSGDSPLLRRMAGDIAGGLQAAAGIPVIAAVMICAVAMGICFMGSFYVLLPLIVESYFQADPDKTHVASALALFSLCFWTGSMVSALVLVRIGHIRRKGLLYLAALATGGAVLVACALTLPFWAFCGLNFIWGLGGGVAMTLGRGLVQHHAPAESRGRILSIFTLGLMGGGPLGAVAYGFLAKAIGPHMAVLVPGLLMLATLALVYALSPLRSLDEDRRGA
jgi:MFS family permease